MKKIVLILMTTCIAVILNAQVNLDFGLVAYYPFNGNAVDETSHGHDGVVNGAILVTDRFGNPNSAYEFNGDGEITIQDHDSLELTGSFSISVWVKRYGDGSHQHLIQKHVRGVDNDGSWALLINGNNPTNIQFVATPDYSSNLFPNSNIVQDEWINIIFTHDKLLSEWRFYINGTLEASGNKVFEILNTTNDMYFGFDHFGPSYPSEYYYNGIMDDIRIYNRKINEDEVHVIYSDVSAINEPVTSKLLFYPNPTTNNIKIDLNDPGLIEVFSISGSLIMKKLFCPEIKTIDFVKIPKGYYLIRLTTEKETYTAKFVKD